MPFAHSEATWCGEKLADVRTASVDKQSPNRAGGVHDGKEDFHAGAGDQSTECRYNTDATEDCAPCMRSKTKHFGKELTDVHDTSANEHSSDNAGGVREGKEDLDVGAGGQGIEFRHVAVSTEDCMLVTHSEAAGFGEQVPEVRNDIFGEVLQIASNHAMTMKQVGELGMKLTLTADRMRATYGLAG